MLLLLGEKNMTEHHSSDNRKQRRGDPRALNDARGRAGLPRSPRARAMVRLLCCVLCPRGAAPFWRRRRCSRSLCAARGRSRWRSTRPASTSLAGSRAHRRVRVRRRCAASASSRNYQLAIGTCACLMCTSWRAPRACTRDACAHGLLAWCLFRILKVTTRTGRPHPPRQRRSRHHLSASSSASSIFLRLLHLLSASSPRVLRTRIPRITG